MADYVKFLGTAGARFVVARQLRYSAGTLLYLHGRRILLDPGPGSLLRCARSRPRIDPAELDAVVLTHAHIDHSGDVNAILDAMTAGGFEQRGRLFAPAECLEGPGAVVLPYLLEHLDEVSALGPSRRYRIGPVRMATSARHRHPAETYGLSFERPPGALAFVADTQYFDGLAESYGGADVLVVSVVRHRPHPDRRIMHLSAADAQALIAEVRPRLAVLTHFGMTMLEAGPGRVAARIARESGVEVVAARDGMKLELA